MQSCCGFLSLKIIKGRRAGEETQNIALIRHFVVLYNMLSCSRSQRFHGQFYHLEYFTAQRNAKLSTKKNGYCYHIVGDRHFETSKEVTYCSLSWKLFIQVVLEYWTFGSTIEVFLDLMGSRSWIRLIDALPSEVIDILLFYPPFKGGFAVVRLVTNTNTGGQSEVVSVPQLSDFIYSFGRRNNCFWPTLVRSQSEPHTVVKFQFIYVSTHSTEWWSGNPTSL